MKIENTNTFIDTLTDLGIQADRVAGLWDGNEPGRMEELAQYATDIKTKSDELIELLRAIDEYTKSDWVCDQCGIPALGNPPMCDNRQCIMFQSIINNYLH